MAGESIAVGILIGIFIGAILGFIIVAFKSYFQVKNAIPNIRNQKIIHLINGKPYDFIGSIDKSLKKVGEGERKRGFFGIFKRNKKKDKKIDFKISGKEREGMSTMAMSIDKGVQKRSTKKFKKKENKKHPYKKARKGVKKK